MFLFCFVLFFSFGMQDLFFIVACRIQFPDQGSNPGPLNWECRVLATGPPGKSLSYLFYTYYQQCIYVNTNLPIPPTPPFPFGIHTFILYVCVSTSALQIRSSIPFFYIPHICINVRYLFFLFLTYFTLYDRLQVHPAHYK